MTTIALSLVSHTNTGKTTLARTLLRADVGEVRDAAHVTEFADAHTLITTPQGDELHLWDTPGFGDSARLAKRLRGSQQPLGWFLSQVWDRWRDRPFWASQQALRHVQAESDVVLYLVNAADSPSSAGYVAAEMELLAWLGKPVLVLLNQMGAPRAAELEAADVQLWRQHLAPWPLVQGVLPLDAFARCWVHESTLLQTVQGLLTSNNGGEKAAAMARLLQAWQARGQATFEAATQELAHSLAQMALLRVPVQGGAMGGVFGGMRQMGGTLKGVISQAFGKDPEAPTATPASKGSDPQSQAQVTLANTLEALAASSTTRLLALHGLEGHAQRQILARVAGQFALQAHVPEGRAALVGGAVTGALAGLKADVATGGFTLGGGMLAGALLGALGAAGVARGINVVRGTDSSWMRCSADALLTFTQAALLRYLAVAHFGRGRGEWVQAESPPHWHTTVAQSLAHQQAALDALWQARGKQPATAAEEEALTTALQPLLQAALRHTLQQLYPSAAHPPHKATP
jgi:GTPase SAR1 family protein